MDTVVRHCFCIIAVVAFLGAVALMVLAWPWADPSDRAPRSVHVALGATVRDFIAENGLSIGERDSHDLAVNADKLSDWMSIGFQYTWIDLRADDGERSIALGTGRTLNVRQTAGRIDGLGFEPFSVEQPLNEIAAYADALGAQLRADGWRPSGPPDTPRTVTDLDFNGTRVFGEHTSPDGAVLQMTVRSYGLFAPTGRSWIVDLFDPPHEKTPIHVLQIRLDDGGTHGYDELIYPRRIFVNGDKEVALPLRVWIEDPDWTPAAAGMVPVPPERRPRYDWSGWEMPQR